MKKLPTANATTCCHPNRILQSLVRKVIEFNNIINFRRSNILCLSWYSVKYITYLSKFDDRYNSISLWKFIVSIRTLSWYDILPGYSCFSIWYHYLVNTVSTCVIRLYELHISLGKDTFTLTYAHFAMAKRNRILHLQV